MKGTLYGVGVGPGDPELLTLKTVRLIRENEVIAVPGNDAAKSAAYQIAVQAVAELSKKALLPIPMPMTKDQQVMECAHEQGAAQICAYLSQGKNVVFLTLGDPTIYSTYSYIQRAVIEKGYETVTVSGIPSFCAAAARLNQPLAEWNQQLHVIPAAHGLDVKLRQDGTYVLMKAGSRSGQLRELLANDGWKAAMIENCGMEQERIYQSVSELPERAGYYSVVIAKK